MKFMRIIHFLYTTWRKFCQLYVYLYENNKHYTKKPSTWHYLGLLYPSTHCDNGPLLSALEFKFIFHCATGLYRNNQRWGFSEINIIIRGILSCWFILIIPQLQLSIESSEMSFKIWANFQSHNYTDLKSPSYWFDQTLEWLILFSIENGFIKRHLLIHLKYGLWSSLPILLAIFTL